MKKIISILFLFTVYFSFAQNVKDYELVLKDFHEGTIKDLIINNETEEIISASYGKILIHNSRNYKYIKTLNLSYTGYLEKIRLINKNQLAIFYNAFKGGSYLEIYDLSTNKIIKKTENVWLTNNNSEDYLALGKKLNDNYYIEFYSKSPFKKIDSITTTYPVKHASISKDFKQVATIEDLPETKDKEGNIELNKNVSLYNIKTNQKSFEKNTTINKSEYVPSTILFEEETFLVLSTPYELHQAVFGKPCGAKFIRYNKTDFKETKLDNFQFCSRYGDTKLIANSKDKILAFGDRDYNDFVELNYKNGKYIIEFNNEKVNHRDDQFPSQFDLGIFNGSTKEYVFMNNGRIIVVDIDKNPLIKNIKKQNKSDNKAFFLNDRSWFIEKGNKNVIAKYFKSGSLADANDIYKIPQNFRKIDKAVDAIKANQIDKKNGKIWFTSQNMIWNESKTLYNSDYTSIDFYSYDIKKTTIDTITKYKYAKKFTIKDFNGKTNAFLLGLENEEIINTATNNRYSTAKLLVLNKEGSYPLDIDIKKYSELEYDKNYRFSENGELLCLSNNGSIIILDWKKNKILFKKAVDWTQKIIPLNETNFLIQNQGYKGKEGNEKVFHSNTLITYKDNEFKMETPENVSIKDATFANGFFVKMNSSNLWINSKNIPLENTPSSISLSDDGKRLFVSFLNGKIRLLDTASLKWLNTIIDTDDYQTLIFNTKGFYYSNMENLGDVLFIKKNNEFYNTSTHGVNLYNPVSILADFGTIDKTYKNVLEKATALRIKANKSSYDNNLIIENFYLSKKRNTYETKTLKNRIQIDLVNETNAILDFDVRINNVNQKNLVFKKLNAKSYEVEIGISQDENLIEIVAKKNKAKSLPIRKNIIYNGRIENRNLYILSIGVSDYKEQENNLSYAHKDALDFAMRYKNFTEEELKYYTKQTAPLSITLNENVIKTNLIDGYNFFYNYDLPTLQLTKNGNKWLQFINEDEDYLTEQIKIWDFEKQDFKLIDLEMPLYLDNFQFTFKTKQDNSGFYFNTFNFDDGNPTKESIFYFDFKKDTLKLIETPFTLDKAFIVNNTNWLAIDKENLLDPEWDLKYTNKEKPITVNVFSKENSNWDIKTYPLKLADSSYIAILKASKNGKLLITAVDKGDYEDENYVIYSLKNNEYIPENIVLEEDGILYNKPLKNWSFNEKNTTLNTVYSDDGEFDFLYSYNLKTGKLTKTKVGDFNENQLVGLNFDEPIFVKQKTPKNKSPYTYDDFINLKKVINKEEQKPQSFKNTFVKYIVNEEATSQNIKNTIKTFFENAKPEDQIVLFLAGHGVLSKKLDYYYATHDMEFKKPEKKGVSFNTIIDLLNESPSIQKLLIMDTCHAGNTLDLDNYAFTNEQTVDGERGTITKSKSKNKDDLKISTVVNSIFDNFVSKTGITVLSASTGENVAYEYENLNNGAFTKSILDILEENIDSNYQYSYTPNKFYFDSNFVGKLQKALSEKTNNKQKLDLREINNLVKIRLW